MIICPFCKTVLASEDNAVQHYSEDSECGKRFEKAVANILGILEAIIER
jgi:hypothetical protein